jgi:acyl-CoA reductase-like NAD-dependent aldehyde dehydrogenase
MVADEVITPALARAGFGDGLVCVVTGPTRDVLPQAFETDVDTLVFFGNAAAGAEVAETGLRRGKKVVLELEGSDPMIVWRDAPLERAAADAGHAFDGSTQLCLAPKQFFVHGAIYEEFVEALVRRAERCTSVSADPEDGTLVPVLRSDGYFRALAELGPLGGVRCGGKRTNARGEPDEGGSFLAPTVITVEASRLLERPPRCLDEEIFFPLVPVIRFDGDDDAIARGMTDMIARSPFGLRASVWTSDPFAIRHFAQELTSVGLLIFNDDHGRVPCYVPPWGGTRRSGGPNGESHFYWEKTTHLQSIRFASSAREDVGALLEGLGALPETAEVG